MADLKKAPVAEKHGEPVTPDDKLQQDQEHGLYLKMEISKDHVMQDEEKRKLANQAYERFTRLKEARTKINGDSIEAIWREAEKNLEGQTEVQDEDDERSNFHVPVSHGIVDSILSEWIRQHSTGKVSAAENKEHQPRAAIMELIRQSVERKNKVRLLDEEMHYDIVGYGNGIQKIYYKEGRRKVHVIDGKNEDGSIKYKEEIVNEWDDICVENVDFWNFYPDDGARKPDFSDARDCIERKILTYSDFEIEYSNYDPAYKFVKRGGDTQEYQYWDKPTDIEDSEVEVVIWWNKARDFLRICANGVLLCDKPLPYEHKQLPFVGGGDNRRRGHFWWKGEPELMRHLQAELNMKRNIRGDGEKMSTLTMFFAPTTGRLEDDEVLVEPGKVNYYQGNTPPIQVKPVTDFTASYMSEDRLKDDIVAATGVDKRSEGLANSNETATEVAVRKEATLKRIAKKIALNQMMVEERRGQLITALIKQYYTTPKVKKICGKDEVEKYEEYEEKMKADSDKYIKDEESGDIYEKSYRRIRAKNKEVTYKTERDDAGKVKNVDVVVREKRGDTFFTALPGMIDGIFEFEITPDVDLPITQAQEIEMSNMLYDRLKDNPVINSVDGNIPGTQTPLSRGMKKLTEDLLKSHNRDSAEYLPDTDEAAASDLGQANKENAAMAMGMELPGTPLASPAHTKLHNDFLEANIKDEKLRNIFNNHILMEVEMQKQLASKQNPNGPISEGPDAGGATATTGVPGPSGAQNI